MPEGCGSQINTAARLENTLFEVFHAEPPIYLHGGISRHKNGESSMDESTQQQNESGSVNPIPDPLIEELRKIGLRPYSEITPAQFGAWKKEKEKRDFENMQRWTKWKAQRMAKLKQGARETIRRNREEQI